LDIVSKGLKVSENIFFDLKRLKYLGVGARIGKTVRIRRPEEVVIGDGCIIDDFTYISCELVLGRNCHIAPNVTISGGSSKVRIGDFVGISAGCSLHAASSDYLIASLDLPSVPEELRFGGSGEEIVLGDHVLLGSHTVVMPGVNLPTGVATGAYTILRKKNYEEWFLYVGYEGKKMTRRNHRRLDAFLSEKFPGATDENPMSSRVMEKT
jgi:acetyltransferase-like isoleucine patch superfamily enzyme